MTDIHKHTRRPRGWALAELDVLVQEELDAMLTRSRPPDSEAPQHASKLNEEERKLIARIAGELRSRTNAEWILEGVHEMLFVERDATGASAADVAQTTGEAQEKSSGSGDA